MLLNGLDLLVCNLALDAKMMGVLALSKTLPQFIQQLNWTISTTFAPKLTIKYAQHDSDGILFELKRASKINALLGTIPLGGLIVFGKAFFSLWAPGQDARLLQTLSILACFWMAFVSGAQPCGNVFVTVNKVKPQAISVIISGVINIISVLLLLKYTKLGIFAIAGMSATIGLTRNLTYTIPAAARYLGFPWYKFFYGFGYSIIGTAVTLIIGWCVSGVLRPASWMALVIACLVTGILAFGLNILVIFNGRELRDLSEIAKVKLSGKAKNNG
jgi:O-antigen/teichoic acid export membrane protein